VALKDQEKNSFQNQKEDGKKVRSSPELNKMSNEGSRFSLESVRRFFNFLV